MLDRHDWELAPPCLSIGEIRSQMWRPGDSFTDFLAHFSAENENGPNDLDALQKKAGIRVVAS